MLLSNYNCAIHAYVGFLKLCYESDANYSWHKIYIGVYLGFRTEISTQRTQL